MSKYVLSGGTSYIDYDLPRGNRRSYCANGGFFLISGIRTAMARLRIERKYPLELSGRLSDNRNTERHFCDCKEDNIGELPYDHRYFGES
jgi:hypothetical protein